MTPTPQQDFVLKTIKSRDVHFVRFWFTDVLGGMKSFAVTPSEIETSFSEGMGFDGSCVQGFCGTEESDMVAFPDASTFQVLPWRPESNAVARMFCTIKTPDGTNFDGDSRCVLQRMMNKAADQGFVMNVGPEIEFYYFKNDTGTEVLDRGGSFDLTSLDYASDLRRDTVLTLEKMGIPVEYSHHERGPSQHEIDLRFNDAVSMADAVMTYKMVVKEIAMKYGVYASFMPKPMAGQPGSGMHMHQSLFDLEGNNVFFDGKDPSGHNLSAIAKSYLAGLLKYAPEYCLVTNQYINSYKRLAGGPEVPRYLAWGRSNRSAMIRVPGYKPSKKGACRLEVRSPDAAANPYLAFACMLAAGLKGIEDKLEPPAPIGNEDLFQLSLDERMERGIQTLPETLGEALDHFETSELMKDVLGEHIHRYLIEAKRAEWSEYLGMVSSWETNRYLHVL